MIRKRKKEVVLLATMVRDRHSQAIWEPEEMERRVEKV